MTEENKEAVPTIAEVATGQAEIDVDKLDLTNPDSLPEDIKNLPFRMPSFGVKRPLWKVLMSGMYNYSKPKVRKLWYEGKLLTVEEYNALPAEDTFAYRNKITKAKRK